jgi:hypothetical protein
MTTLSFTRPLLSKEEAVGKGEVVKTEIINHETQTNWNIRLSIPPAIYAGR